MPARWITFCATLLVCQSLSPPAVTAEYHQVSVSALSMFDDLHGCAAFQEVSLDWQIHYMQQLLGNLVQVGLGLSFCICQSNGLTSPARSLPPF
jgi:hypothetical protein